MTCISYQSFSIIAMCYFRFCLFRLLQILLLLTAQQTNTTGPSGSTSHLVMLFGKQLLSAVSIRTIDGIHCTAYSLLYR